MNDQAIIEILTTKDLQQIMRCGRRQAYELMRARAFPSIKIGAKYIVEKEALQKWLASNRGKEFLV